MALDAATLALVARELGPALDDSRIDKITQPTRDEVLLQMHSRQGGTGLFISARSGSARASLTNETFENPAVPPSFCMLLRKYLIGGRFTGIRTIPGERILFFDFQCTTPMRDAAGYTIAAELMGRYSNLVLVGEDGRVVDALKRVDAEASALRQLLPGLVYTLPPSQNKPVFLDTAPDDLVRGAAELPLPVADALLRTSVGVGPVVCREAAYRAFGSDGPLAAEMSPEQRSALAGAIDQVQSAHRAGGMPGMVYDEEGRGVEFSFLPLTQYPAAMPRRAFGSFVEMLEGYYSEKDRAERLRQRSKTLAKQTAALYERAQRKQAARKEELAQSEDCDALRVAGELLSANLHSLTRGQNAATVLNYYTGEEVTLRLDPRLSPAQNAQKYFKDYKKKTTGAKMLAHLLEQGERELEYLSTVRYEVSRAENEQALEEIRAELKEQGYLRSYKPRQKRAKQADFLRYRSSDGFLILVGRNNAQNDRLSLKTARGKDLWFHVKNAPGSHTVVMSEGQDIPLQTQNEAAALAVYHSSLRETPKAPVDYTQVRNLRKTGDLPPGMVLYEHYETAYVTAAGEELLARLAQPAPGRGGKK